MSSLSDEWIDRELRTAMASFRKGDVDGARARVEQLYLQVPERTEVLFARGVLLTTGGELAEGLRCLTAGLSQNPNDREALAWSAHAAIGLKQYQEAETHALRFVSLEPHNARGYSLLALAQEGRGQGPEALVSIEGALAVRPDDVEALMTQARLLKSLAMPNLASNVYRRVLSIRMHPGAAVALAQILLLRSRPAEALDVLEKALPAIPDELKPYDLIGQAQTELLRFEEAQASWALASRHASDRVALARRRAAAEIAVGRFEVAESQLRELLDSGVDTVRSFYLLTTARKMRSDDSGLIERLEKLTSSPDLPPLDRVQAHSALGKTYDDLRDYGRAIAHFDEANRLNFEMYVSMARNPETIDRMRSFTDAQLELLQLSPPSRANTSDLPILVMGMPRSGTTLMASILSAHSMVSGGEENSFWRERSMFYEQWFEGGLSVDWESASRFATEYLQFLASNGSGAEHVVDKTPSNFYRAALLHRLLPNARMVHLLRHPVDNALSMWMNLFQDSGSFTSNRANLVAAYREHQRLVRGLQERLPEDRFRIVRYEELTSEPERSIGSVLNFLGLAHERACSEPEKNARAINTPSVLQVRQPINTGSQNRWRNYEPWLGEFAELLDEPKF